MVCRKQQVPALAAGRCVDRQGQAGGHCLASAVLEAAVQLAQVGI